MFFALSAALTAAKGLRKSQWCKKNRSLSILSCYQHSYMCSAEGQSMLKIRETQMKTLSEYTLRQFENRMAVYLRTTFPKQTKDLPEAELRVMIHTGIAQAAQYNVTIEDDVRRYLEYLTMYSVDFATNPQSAWAGEILCTQNLSGGEKMDRIDEYDLFGPRGQL
jgi:hypothetical protein